MITSPPPQPDPAPAAHVRHATITRGHLTEWRVTLNGKMFWCHWSGRRKITCVR